MTVQKILALLLGNGGNIRDFEGANKSTKPMTPLINTNKNNQNHL